MRVRIHNETGNVHGVAVLDTGASISVVDRHVARAMGLPSPGAAEWMGVNATGERSMAALRRCQLEVVGDRRLHTLDLLEMPGLRVSVPGLHVVALLGWDFLGRCRLSCDGPAGAFEFVLPR